MTLINKGRFAIRQDQVTRTTELYVELNGHKIRSIGTAPGILTRKKAMAHFGVTDVSQSRPSSYNPVCLKR